MHDVSTVTLTRDCEAVQIPVGTATTLSKGAEVFISQRLGGTFTVRAQGGLFRISAKDADALGLEAGSPAAEAKTAPAGPVEEQLVWDALKTCYDPEIPVNIVDLGLVYDLYVENIPGGGAKVFVKMTLTAPGCGMGPVIAGDAQHKILALSGVEDASVEIVWDPPWHQSMITSDGRRILGLE